MVRYKRSPTRKKIKFFFLEGKLYKALRQSRAKDELVAWCYADHKRSMFSYSQVDKYGGKAYSINDVCRILGRHEKGIKGYIIEGKVKTPTLIYPLHDPESKTWSMYILSEQEVLDIHQYILENGNPHDLPSRAEVLAMLRTDVILYTKTGEGGFVPVWKAD